MAEANALGQTLGLIFEEASDSPAESHPTMAQIFLQTYVAVIMREGYPQPVYTLTPVDYEPDAFDVHADRLISNIQRLKELARARFAEARRRGH